MAYNSGFPIGYGYQMPVMQQPAPQENSMVWVQGEAGAKSYLMAPNKTLPLWDSEAQVIYLKSTDSSGMPSMKVLDYTIRETSALPHKAPINTKDEEYVTKEELEAFREEIAHKLEEVKEGLGA